MSYMTTLRGFPSPHWAVSLAFALIVIDLFQVLLWEWINDSTNQTQLKDDPITSFLPLPKLFIKFLIKKNPWTWNLGSEFLETKLLVFQSVFLLYSKANTCVCTLESDKHHSFPLPRRSFLQALPSPALPFPERLSYRRCCSNQKQIWKHLSKRNGILNDRETLESRNKRLEQWYIKKWSLKSNTRGLERWLSG